jgi:hypothetical protein
MVVVLMLVVVVMQEVVLFANHVNLFVPARLSAATARRVVKRQIHTGV